MPKDSHATMVKKYKKPQKSITRYIIDFSYIKLNVSDADYSPTNRLSGRED